MMFDVGFEQRRIHGNENCIAIYRCDADSDDDEIFAFSDEDAYEETYAMCDAIAYTQKTICVSSGWLGGRQCVVLLEENSHAAQVFAFRHDEDFAMAQDLAIKFLELKDSDNEEQ